MGQAQRRAINGNITSMVEQLEAVEHSSRRRGGIILVSDSSIMG